MTAVRVGTSGWNDPSGPGTWNGLCYPAGPGCRGAGTFDELSGYAEHFDTVDVNSPFYGQPRAEVTRGWADRTPADVDNVRRGVAPLAEAGKLGTVLAQFPPRLKASPESEASLHALLGALGEYPVAVELRHKSWSDAFGRTLDWLNADRAALVERYPELDVILQTRNGPAPLREPGRESVPVSTRATSPAPRPAPRRP